MRLLFYFSICLLFILTTKRCSKNKGNDSDTDKTFKKFNNYENDEGNKTKILSLEIKMYPSKNSKTYEIFSTGGFNSIIIKANDRVVHYIDSLTFSNSVFDFSKGKYQNKCIEDGEVFNLVIYPQSSDKNKISFQNYYHKDLDSIITFINRHVKKKDIIYYNKDKLTSLMKDCN